MLGPLAVFVGPRQDASNLVEGVPTMRMQLIFREGVAHRRDQAQASWQTAAVDRESPAQIMIGLGLVEAPRGAVEGEKVSDVLMGADAGGLFLRFAGPAYDPELRWAGESDLPGLATEIRARPPQEWSPDLAFGSFYLRETRFPAAADHVVHAAIGLVAVRRGSLPERVMFDVQARDGALVQTAASHEPDAFEIGSGIGQTFAEPIWGWDGPKRAILSTLTLETIDAMARIRALEGLPEPTRGQEAELAALNQGPAGSVLACRRSDPTFRRYLEIAREMGLHEQLAVGTDDYPDAEGLARREQAAASVMRRLTDDELDPSYAPRSA